MSGVATANIPSGAVASELAKDGKKKTILRDLGTTNSSLTVDDRAYAARSCHVGVCDL